MSESAFDATVKFTTFLKSGSGYDAASTTVRSNSLEEHIADLEASADARLIAAREAARIAHLAPQAAPSPVAQASQQFANAGMVNQAQVTDAYAADAAQGGPGAFAAPMPPAPAAQAPASHPNAPQCKHGAMQYKTGTVKNGKNAGKQWKAWDCPTPTGTPDRCDRQWIN